ncbi:MAG: prepilin-type N-terminal cleavage/methylation domain-containing protein [Coriobacteriia bacterium]|nr:prepilin-type N-terminal cleavage/methylation domain-containing protein [Coriobacteriia bacterium]
MMVTRRHRDDGFTLTELVVVIALLGVVLGGAYAMFSVAARASAESNREAWMSREIGQPLEYAERVFSQQTALTMVDAYRLEGTTDRDNDNCYETYLFEVTTDGRLLITSSEASDNPTPMTATWSTDNRNQAESVPLFRYYDVAGNDIGAEAGSYIAQYATSVVVTIVAEHEGDLIESSRRVYFRNR